MFIVIYFFTDTFALTLYLNRDLNAKNLCDKVWTKEYLFYIHTAFRKNDNLKKKLGI